MIYISCCSSVCRISVEGYDTSVHAFDVELTLRKHLSSCGEVKNVNVPKDLVRRILKRFACGSSSSNFFTHLKVYS